MLKYVKVRKFFVGVSGWVRGGCEKYVVEHKKLGGEKICICRKVGVTLHSLSGGSGPRGGPNEWLPRKHKDIEKLTIDKK